MKYFELEVWYGARAVEREKFLGIGEVRIGNARLRALLRYPTERYHLE